MSKKKKKRKEVVVRNKDHPVLGPKIKADDADRKFWQLKVKNRLQQ
jgi:hypothetical protein